MERNHAFEENEYYHLYNRGVDKRVIFSNASDYRRFLMLLYLANSDLDTRISNTARGKKFNDTFTLDRGNPLIAIGAYCLMPNHFHILATPLVENGIPKFMRKLLTGYSMYFNTKNERKGSLFQGPYRSTYADSDRYLHYLYSYIHLNPAKLHDPHWKDHLHARSNLIKFVERYPYSSYAAYLNGHHIITDPQKFPDYFSSRDEIVSHIIDWLMVEE